MRFWQPISFYTADIKSPAAPHLSIAADEACTLSLRVQTLLSQYRARIGPTLSLLPQYLFQIFLGCRDRRDAELLHKRIQYVRRQERGQ